MKAMRDMSVRDKGAPHQLLYNFRIIQVKLRFTADVIRLSRSICAGCYNDKMTLNLAQNTLTTLLASAAAPAAAEAVGEGRLPMTTNICTTV